MAASRSKLFIRALANAIELNWIDGVAPFQLQRSSDLKTWENAWNPSMARSRSFINDGGSGYFRLQEAVMLLDIDLSYEPGTKLVWTVPDLE